MKHSSAATALVKASEGLSLVAYPDPATHSDPWTIGYGATGVGITRGVRWTSAQADERLEQDLERFDAGVTALIGRTPTTQGQFDAMVVFAFNVGLGSLRSSTLLNLHRIGDYAAAAAQFARWNKAAGVVLPGLTKRRAAEAAMYRGQA